MPFHASKPVECIRCHIMIAQGEPIAWARKGPSGVYHFACPSETPAAITFAQPEPVPAIVEPATDLYTDDEMLPEIEPEPLPGSRAWLRTATMAEREDALVAFLHEGLDEGPVTRRQFVRAVISYSRELPDKHVLRFRRYARGLWDGLTVNQVDETVRPDTSGQLTMLESWQSIDTETHGRETQAWRDLFATEERMSA